MFGKEKFQNLDDFAKKVIKAENDKEIFEIKRKDVFADILEAEDSNDQKQVAKSKEKLREIDREIEIASERIKKTKSSMDNAAKEIIQKRLDGLPDEKTAFSDDVKKAQRKFAEYLAGAQIWAEALGMGNVVIEIGNLFKPIPGFYSSAEDHFLIGLINEEKKRISTPPNIRQKRLELDNLDIVKSNYVSISAYAQKLVARAMNSARRGEENNEQNLNN